MVYVPDFVTPDEEAALLDVLEELDFQEVQMRGQTAKRRVTHFGLDYDYEHGNVSSGEPLPESLEWVRERVADIAGIASEQFVETLVSRYPSGAGIGWHRDAPMFGSPIAGVSLGSASRMRFQRGKGEERETAAVELAQRSAYLLGGPARWTWQHSIPASRGLRYSITFRTLKG